MPAKRKPRAVQARKAPHHAPVPVIDEEIISNEVPADDLLMLTADPEIVNDIEVQNTQEKKRRTPPLQLTEKQEGDLAEWYRSNEMLYNRRLKVLVNNINRSRTSSSIIPWILASLP